MDSEQSQNWNPQELVPAVEQLSSAVQAGDLELFQSALDSVSSIRERSLFQEIGKLTRQLHEALAAADTDSRIAEVARREFPDARGRLDQVIAMTDKSAHRTMDLVEEGISLLDEMVRESRMLSGRWASFRRKQIQGDEFRALVDEVSGFLSANEERGNALRNTLNEVLMAQDFQDLCGQEIRKVMRTVQEVENTLINMIRAPGSINAETQPDSKAAQLDAGSGGKLGQDEADEILSSLGF